jgi:flagellin
MSFSVNYNYSAALAVQTLSATQEALDASLSRTASGLKVQSAADDAIAFAASEVIKTQRSGNQTVLNYLKTGRQALDIGLKSGNQIAALVDKMTAVASRATDPTLTTEDLAGLNAEYQGLFASLKTALDNSNTSGTGLPSLLTGGAANAFPLDGVALATTAATSGARLTLTGRNWTVTTFSIGGTLSDVTAAATVLTRLITAKSTISSDLGTLGASAVQIESAISNIQKMVDAQRDAIGALVDANMGVEAAASQSLQIKQQLNTQAVAIANSAPKVLLTLFGL